MAMLRTKKSFWNKTWETLEKSENGPKFNLQKIDNMKF